MAGESGSKVAIVTGAGRGIGKAVALRLAAGHTSVVIADLDPGTARETADEVAGAGARSLAVGTDVTDRAQVERLVARTLAEFGRIDILINNAGWTRTQPFLEDTPDYWHKVMATNFLSQVYTCRAVLEPMIAQGGGCIVNVSSDAARVGSAGQALYAAAKAAVIAFSKSLVLEVSKHNIRVNVVSPSATDTVLARETIPPDQMARWARAIPLGRFAQPADQANAIVFFTQDESSYITGQVLSVNGGSTRVG